MANRGDVYAFQAAERIGFHVERRFRVYPEKELCEISGTTYVRQCGYDEETVLEVGNCPIAVGLWNVIPLPPGGSVRIPLLRHWGDTPLAAIPAEVMAAEEGYAVVSCPADKPFRVWMESSDARTRFAYVVEQRDGGRSLLVVKEYQQGRSGGYAVEHGTPPLAPAAGISCAGPRAPCCELSFRSPAAGRAAGGRRVVWKSSLWAFSGRNEEILALARRLTA